LEQGAHTWLKSPFSRSKSQKSRSSGRFTHRGVYTSSSCSGERGKVFTVGTYYYVAVCRCGSRLGHARRPQREERGEAYRGGRPPTACYICYYCYCYCYNENITLTYMLLLLLFSSIATAVIWLAAGGTEICLQPHRNVFHHRWYIRQSTVNEYVSLIITEYQSWCIIPHYHVNWVQKDVQSRNKWRRRIKGAIG